MNWLKDSHVRMNSTRPSCYGIVFRRAFRFGKRGKTSPTFSETSARGSRTPRTCGRFRGATVRSSYPARYLTQAEGRISEKERRRRQASTFSSRSVPRFREKQDVRALRSRCRRRDCCCCCCCRCRVPLALRKLFANLHDANLFFCHQRWW